MITVDVRVCDPLEWVARSHIAIVPRIRVTQVGLELVTRCRPERLA